ncbi:5435_t:CDS:2, partial [Dentiscutata erythropus]
MIDQKEICKSEKSLYDKNGVIIGKTYFKPKRINKSTNYKKGEDRIFKSKPYQELEEYKELEFNTYEELDNYSSEELDNYNFSNISKALRLLYLKAKNTYISNNNFEEILQIFDCNGPTLYSTKKILQKLVDIDVLFIDMCINSCIAFTDKYKDAIQCPICLSARFQKDNIANKVAAYYPLTSRLRFQYANSERSKTFRYCSNYKLNVNEFNDIFDGQLYKNIPAISKLTHLVGHNGYMGCRFCDIKGVTDTNSGVNHYYMQQVVWIEDGGEELWAPSQNYTLNNKEFA